MPSTYLIILIVLFLLVLIQYAHRKKRYSLRTLLIAMTIACVVLGVIVAIRN